MNPLCPVGVKLSALIEGNSIRCTRTYLGFGIRTVTKPHTKYIRFNSHVLFFALYRSPEGDLKIIPVTAFFLLRAVAHSAFHELGFNNTKGVATTASRINKPFMVLVTPYYFAVSERYFSISKILRVDMGNPYFFAPMIKNIIPNL